MSYHSRMQALLQLVENDRSARRGGIIEAARNDANACVAQAHRCAREHLRVAWREERARYMARIGAAQAELQTRLRLASQERERALIARAFTGLGAEFERRWADRDARTLWVKHAVAQAVKMLAPGSWCIEHAPALSDEERRAITAELDPCGVDASFRQSESLRAGLRIVAGATAIDATLNGLVADTDEIGARLLALIETAP